MYKLKLGRNLTYPEFKAGSNEFLEILKKLYNQIEETNIEKKKIVGNLIFVLIIMKNERLNMNK